MDPFDEALNGLARGRRSLVVRSDALAAGGEKKSRGRRRTGRWTTPHAGVYSIGVVPLDWHGQLLAAVLAAGDGAAASHRAGVVLRSLDGIHSAPLEITVPYTHGPVPAGVIVHRTRRLLPIEVVDGILTTSVERTLVDSATCLPPSAVEKAMEAAIRRGLTTATKLDLYLTHECGKGVRGTRVLKEILLWRTEGRAAGSAAEVEFLRALRGRGIPDPVRQFEVRLLDGTVAVLDFAWVDFRKAVDIDGLDAHASAAALDYDLERQNKLGDVGWALRRFTGRRVMRQPDATAAQVARFLRSPHVL